MATVDPQHRVLMIRLTQTYPQTIDSPAAFRSALYDATSKWWKVSASRTEPGPGSPQFAFAVYQGIVRAVYTIGGWRRSPDGSRFAFSGTESTELSERYVGSDVAEYFPHGAVNPLRFVNCDPVVHTGRTSVELHAAEHPSLEQRLLELRQTARELQREPLAHIMYGSRELFPQQCPGVVRQALAGTGKRRLRLAVPGSCGP